MIIRQGLCPDRAGEQSRRRKLGLPSRPGLRTGEPARFLIIKGRAVFPRPKPGFARQIHPVPVLFPGFTEIPQWIKPLFY
jgi:hypothetical protein